MTIDHLGGSAKIFPAYPSKRRKTALLLSLLQALPLQLRELFDQLFHLLVVLDRFPNAPFPLPRNEQLAQLSPLPSNQVETIMEFPLRAATAGFATANVSQREGTAQQTSLVNDLRQAGAASPFVSGELCTGHRGPPSLTYHRVRERVVINGQRENANLL